MYLPFFVIAFLAFPLNHAFMRALSRRDISPQDMAMFAWCFLYIPYVMLAYYFANSTEARSTGGLLNAVEASFAFHSLPTLISAVLAYHAWKSPWPPALLILAATLICILPAMGIDFFYAFAVAPIVWNFAYAAACIPIALRQRTHDARTASNQCRGCGYPKNEIPTGSPCPECGLGG